MNPRLRSRAILVIVLRFLRRPAVRFIKASLKWISSQSQTIEKLKLFFLEASAFQKIVREARESRLRRGLIL
jgi:hypothetical protein